MKKCSRAVKIKDINYLCCCCGCHWLCGILIYATVIHPSSLSLSHSSHCVHSILFRERIHHHHISSDNSDLFCFLCEDAEDAKQAGRQAGLALDIIISPQRTHTHTFIIMHKNYVSEKEFFHFHHERLCVCACV
jgi:hypothetical protein